MAIVIKKRVGLDFLGDDYKEAFLTFQSIPLTDYEEIMEGIKKATESNTSPSYILNTLKKYFIEGSVPGTDVVSKEDLDGLDQETTIKCFSVFTGTEINKQDGEVSEVADLKAE